MPKATLLKTALSGLTLAGLVAGMLGATAAPSSALPVIQPQTTQRVAYWHHRRHHRRRHGGLTIHL